MHTHTPACMHAGPACRVLHRRPRPSPPPSPPPPCSNDTSVIRLFGRSALLTLGSPTSDRDWQKLWRAELRDVHLHVSRQFAAGGAGLNDTRRPVQQQQQQPLLADLAEEDAESAEPDDSLLGSSSYTPAHRPVRAEGGGSTWAYISRLMRQKLLSEVAVGHHHHQPVVKMEAFLVALRGAAAPGGILGRGGVGARVQWP